MNLNIREGFSPKEIDLVRELYLKTAPKGHLEMVEAGWGNFARVLQDDFSLGAWDNGGALVGCVAGFRVSKYGAQPSIEFDIDLCQPKNREKLEEYIAYHKTETPGFSYQSLMPEKINDKTLSDYLTVNHDDIYLSGLFCEEDMWKLGIDIKLLSKFTTKFPDVRNYWTNVLEGTPTVKTLEDMNFYSVSSHRQTEGGPTFITMGLSRTF